MSFFIKDDEVMDKYNKIQDVIKDKLGINFHSEAAYEYKYLKAKVSEFENFLGNDMPKEIMHYTCIACITIDSAMNFDKKKSSSSLFRRVQIQGEKNTNVQILNTELKSYSESSDSDLDSEKIGARVDNELMAKLKKSESDSE